MTLALSEQGHPDISSSGAPKVYLEDKVTAKQEALLLSIAEVLAMQTWRGRADYDVREVQIIDRMAAALRAMKQAA